MGEMYLQQISFSSIFDINSTSLIESYMPVTFVRKDEVERKEITHPFGTTHYVNVYHGAFYGKVGHCQEYLDHFSRIRDYELSIKLDYWKCLSTNEWKRCGYLFFENVIVLNMHHSNPYDNKYCHGIIDFTWLESLQVHEDGPIVNVSAGKSLESFLSKMLKQEPGQ